MNDYEGEFDSNQSEAKLILRISWSNLTIDGVGTSSFGAGVDSPGPKTANNKRLEAQRVTKILKLNWYQMFLVDSAQFCLRKINWQEEK